MICDILTTGLYMIAHGYEIEKIPRKISDHAKEIISTSALQNR